MARLGLIDDRASDLRQHGTAHEPRGGEGDAAAADPAIRQLPGVVNDLPEVAPHEWIYLMS